MRRTMGGRDKPGHDNYDRGSSQDISNFRLNSLLPTETGTRRKLSWVHSFTIVMAGLRAGHPFLRALRVFVSLSQSTRLR